MKFTLADIERLEAAITAHLSDGGIAAARILGCKPQSFYVLISALRAVGVEIELKHRPVDAATAYRMRVVDGDKLEYIAEVLRCNPTAVSHAVKRHRKAMEGVA